MRNNSNMTYNTDKTQAKSLLGYYESHHFLKQVLIPSNDELYCGKHAMQMWSQSSRVSRHSKKTGASSIILYTEHALQDAFLLLSTQVKNFTFKLVKFHLYSCERFCLNVCLCTMCLLDAHRGQKRARELEHLKLRVMCGCGPPCGCSNLMYPPMNFKLALFSKFHIETWHLE